MFICRHQLLRASVPRSLPLLPATRRFLPDNRTTPYLQSNVGGLGGQTASVVTTSRPEGGGDNSKAPTSDDSNSELDTSKTASTSTANATPRQAANVKLIANPHKPHKPLQPVTTPRKPSKTIHDFTTLCHAVKEATLQQQLHKLGPLVVKHWDLIQGQGQESRMRFLYNVVKTLSMDKAAHLDHLLKLLQLHETTGDIRLMPFAYFSLIISGIVHRTEINPQEAPILTITTRILLSKLHQDRGRRVVWILFSIMRRYIRLRQDAEVFAILQTLVQGKHIPTSALQNIDLSSRNFQDIVLTVQLRCIDLWGWYGRATLILNDILASSGKLSPMLAEAMVKIMDRLLVRLANRDLIGASAILVRLLTGSEKPLVPTEMLTRFYAICKTAEEGQLANTVYKLTREKQLLAIHTYPCPAHDHVLWYMDYFASVHDEHAARLLATDVVDGNIPLPFHDRIPFITRVASLGFTTQTRALWEKYAVQDRDADFVAGNSAVMLKVVSLCASRVSILKSKAIAVARRQQMGNSAKTGKASALPSPRAVTHNNTGDVTRTPTITPHSTIVPSVSGGDADAEQQAQWYEQLAEDIRSFADRVLEIHRHSRQPLKEATHNELNALARAYFLMDRMMEGFEMFSIMLKRKEIPDLQDVNVMLSAMAKHDPGHSTLLLERMVEMGLQPDAVSFGTVIHCAILHDKMDLARYLIHRAREVGIEQLTYKTMGSLIRACVQKGQSGQSNMARNLHSLDDAKKLIDSLLDSGFMPSPAMGKDCIAAALRAEDPMTAFEFWQILVKDKTEWTDSTQMGVRASIAREFIRLYSSEWISSSRGQEVFCELGQARWLSSQPAHARTGEHPARD